MKNKPTVKRTVSKEMTVIFSFMAKLMFPLVSNVLNIFATQIFELVSIMNVASISSITGNA